MSALNPFIRNFVDEAMKKNSIHTIYDEDLNGACFQLSDKPIDITPAVFRTDGPLFSYSNPQTLLVLPSKNDSENYLVKAELLAQSLHGMGKQAVFEIRGNGKRIACCFRGEKSDIEIIDSAVRNFYPKTITDITEEKPIDGKFRIFDFLPDAAFFKALTTHRGFVISPLNLIPMLLKEVKEPFIGTYQVIFTPLPGECHQMVQEAVDTEWKALQGADHQIPPSLQANAVNEKIEYKSPDFRSYFAVCFRLILPDTKQFTAVNPFISSYIYGSKGFKTLGNEPYSQSQILDMLNNGTAYHTGFLVNSHELVSISHLPFQILENKDFTDIFAAAPAGDKPIKMLEYEDIVIGAWAGNNAKEIHLPPQREITNVHIIGVPRAGKSVALCHIALEKFRKGECCFVLDHHGDLIESIKQNIPKERINDAIVIDFGLKNLTPQITIRGNVDIANPSRVADDMSESMRDATSGQEKFYGPRMSYFFSCVYFIYSVLPDLNLTDIRLLLLPTKKAKFLRTKVKARIRHPVIRDFLSEIEFLRYETVAPAITRLSHLLLDEKSLRLFTLEKNKISISDIMENGKLCLVNLACGIIGKQRSSILSGLTDSLISNNALSRASIPYRQRKPCTLIKDEFYLGPGDLDSELTGLAKYNVSVIFAHQYLKQVDGKTREVMGTAGSRLVFKVRQLDAEILSREFNLNPEELTSLRKFQAFIKVEDEVVKINTPKPMIGSERIAERVMRNSIEKYYLRHNPYEAPEKKKLSYDVL